jgi:hypothetical protein
MILYCRTSNTFQAVVYDASGTVVNTPAEAAFTMYASYFDAKETKDGNVIVAYLDSNNYLGYLILNSSGVITYTNDDVAGEDAQDFPTITVLDSGNYFYAWYDDNTYGGIFMIFNPSNGVVKSPTQIYTGDMPGSYFASVWGIDTLSDGSVVIHAVYSGKSYAVFYTEDGDYIETHDMGDGPNFTTIIKVIDQLNDGKIAFGIPYATQSKFSLISGTT